MRKTLQQVPSKPAPFRVLLLTLPAWGASLALTFVMPLTGVVGSVLIVVCVLVLPFKARQGACPSCGRRKLFPFSGFGSYCKGCGKELVLRGREIHLLEEKVSRGKPGTGRGHQPLRR